MKLKNGIVEMILLASAHCSSNQIVAREYLLALVNLIEGPLISLADGKKTGLSDYARGNENRPSQRLMSSFLLIFPLII